MLLFLNDIAGSEVLVILVVVLMFFGSKSIPSIAQTLGRTIRQIKDASNDLQSEIKKSGMDIKKDLNLEGLIQDTAREVQQPLDQSVSELNEAVAYTPPSNETSKIESPAAELPAENQSEIPLTEEKKSNSG